jgi:tetratricopeptide (TPR) repeat protein
MNKLSYIKYLTVVFFLLLGQSGKCCLNEYRTLLNGEVFLGSRGNSSPIGRYNVNNKLYLLKNLHRAESLYRQTGKLEDYSDWGTMLVYSGQYLKAKQIFQEIEQKNPGLYQTSANLGTVYELLGKNDSALYWIKRAVAINPSSHRGSEWIHVKILEAKIKANGNENYLWTNSILSLDFGDDKIPVNRNNLDLKNLGDQLYDQLNERMSFIKPKDPIVAQLLFDLGNILALRANATSGLQVYQTAQEYGYSSELFDKRLSYFEKLQFKADLINKIKPWAEAHLMFALIIILTIFVLSLVLIGIMFIRMKNRRQEKNSTNH